MCDALNKPIKVLFNRIIKNREMFSEKTLKKVISINAQKSKVWNALTNPDQSMVIRDNNWSSTLDLMKTKIEKS